MNNSSAIKSASRSVITRLLDWSTANLYLSLANVLAALIALGTTVEVIKSCIHVNQLELGVLAIPFIVCLDILFIVLVASLFVRRPSGSIMYLGFIAILIVPQVGSSVVIDVLHSLSGVSNVPDAASSRLIESGIILALSILYLGDIVNRISKAKESRATS